MLYRTLPVLEMFRHFLDCVEQELHTAGLPAAVHHTANVSKGDALLAAAAEGGDLGELVLLTGTIRCGNTFDELAEAVNIVKDSIHLKTATAQILAVKNKLEDDPLRGVVMKIKFIGFICELHLILIPLWTISTSEGGQVW